MYSGCIVPRLFYFFAFLNSPQQCISSLITLGGQWDMSHRFTLANVVVEDTRADEIVVIERVFALT